MSDPIENAIDRFNNKGIERIQQMALFFLLSLLRPLATVTEKLYREKMGERYFTLWNVFAGLWMIFLASSPPIYHGGTNGDVWSMSDWLLVGVGMFWAYRFIMGSRAHFREVKERYRTGTIWHSYCYGSWETARPWLRPTIFMVTGGLVVMLSQWWNWPFYGIGGLLAASGLISLQTHFAIVAKTHAMLLDTIDQQIVNQNLADAIRDQFPANRTQGLIAPLPARVSKEYRDEVAPSFRRPTENPYTQPAVHEAAA